MLKYEHGGDIYSNSDVRLDFSVNTNPLGMPESVKRALSENIADFERYPDPHCRALTAALAANHGVEKGMILCGSGAAELILRICACLKPRKALTLAPTFSEYERSVALFGGEVQAFTLIKQNGFALTERILDELPPGTDMLFLCNPNNPTGRLIDPELLRRIAEKLEAEGVYLILDECFLDFTDGESMIPLLKAHPHLMVLRAFTKLYSMAGLRLGYLLCADTELLSRIERFGQTWSVSVPAQTAGLASLKEADWAERTRQLIKHERTFMMKELSELGLAVFPSDANFLLVESETPLYPSLLRRGMLVRSCANFSGLGELYLRIGLKTRDKNKALLCALSEVLNG